MYRPNVGCLLRGRICPCRYVSLPLPNFATNLQLLCLFKQKDQRKKKMQQSTENNTLPSVLTHQVSSIT